MRKRLAACPRVQVGRRTKSKSTPAEAEMAESPEEILYRMKFGRR